MSKEYRKATHWELSPVPLQKAQERRKAAHECGNALEAARHAVHAVEWAIDARRRGQAVDGDNVYPEDMLKIKDNATQAALVAAQTLQVARGVMGELYRRIETEREDVRPAARKAAKERRDRASQAALGSRGPYASICGTYRACARVSKP